MAVSYGLLKGLKPSYFSTAERVIIEVPLHIAERYKTKGVKPIFTIDFEEQMVSKESIFQKIDELIESLINRVPGLYFHHFNFRVEGTFSGGDYV